MSLFINISGIQNQYTDCSILDVSETIERDCLSVLHKLHDQVNGLQLVQVVVQPLANIFNIRSTYMMSPDTAQDLIARLDADGDVNWLMEIIGYGLSMPFSLTGEQDSVKDCCTIYCEWMGSALLPYNEHNEDKKYQQLSKLVPVPIRKDPNKYARKMLSHLYNVFLPRHSVASSSNQKDQAEANLTAVSRQAVLCHRVLRTIENIAQNPANLMDGQTWDHILALLLTINDKLLSSPTEPDDIGTQLHDRILGVLFDLMLLASARCIPTSSLWKTFNEMCLNWRHRPALVDHWKRITLSLTKRIVQMSSVSKSNRSQDSDFGNENNEENVLISTTNNSIIDIAIASMSYEILSQTWYRFLNLIGNPVELSNPNTISRTDEFYHSACVSDNVLDPRQHPCLSVLPQIFMNSMVGLRDFIESFIGSYHQVNESSNELFTQDRQSQNQSVLNSSITSSNNISVTSSTSNQTLCTPQQSPPQAMTPTQQRKSGIKSLAMKGSKVIPFSSNTSNMNPSNTPVESSPIQEHSRSGSSSSRPQQYTQSRPSLVSVSSRTSQTQQKSQFRLFNERPKCNSLLHIFGDWLYSAALIGSDLNQQLVENDETMSSGTASLDSNSTTTEVSGIKSSSPSLSKRNSLLQRTIASHASSTSRQQSQSTGKQSTNSTSTSLAEKIMLDPPLSVDSFESGQAEAMAILCKIFSSKTSSEDISPAYLSRFYICLQHCLTFGTGQDQEYNQPNTGCTIKRQLLASVLINSTTLLKKDLDGINLLIPSFIKAIEFVFECSEKEVPIQPPPRQHNRSGSVRYSNSNVLNNMTNFDLRRASIQTLLNLLVYPFHFQDLIIRNCLNDSSPTTTFGSLRSRLMRLLFVALQTETDPTNMQMLFGGLSLAIHDLSSNTNKRAQLPKDIGTKSRQKSDLSDIASSGNDSANSSLEASRQDDTSSQSSFVFNSKGGFIVKSLHVTCHLLINIWKHDTQVSLAALELLTAIARVSTLSSSTDEHDLIGPKCASRVSNNNNNDNTKIEMRNEYKQTTKWICDYICNQCSRPPPAHSRDMHSTIVAAYQCLSVWFHEHPYLLNDKDCVVTLMEVIELGVSGQKSRTISVDSTTLTASINKSEKIMKPSSMRVREAAESLLNICMVRAKSLNNLSSKGMHDTILDEQSITDTFSGSHYRSSIRQIQDAELRRLESFKLFKYFSDEDSVIFGLLEGLNHNPATKDSVICLLRTPFGKHCWRMKFNYYTEKSRDKIIANKTLGLIKRPFQQSTTPTSDSRMFTFPTGHNKSLYFNNSAKYFPETVDNLPSNELDRLVTDLDNYVEACGSNLHLKNDLNQLNKIFSHQTLAEQKVIGECSIRVRRVECEEPQPMTDLEAARMIVTHLGLKTALSPISGGDKTTSMFVSDLKSLDHQSVRTCDSASLFYVRRGRTTSKEILESVRTRRNVSLEFFEWILELGQSTVVKSHSRWTGKASSSWNSPTTTVNALGDSSESRAFLSRNQMLTSDHGGAIFDGDRMTLYWSDMCQELAFLVHHKIERTASRLAGSETKTPSEQFDNSSASTSSPMQEAPYDNQGRPRNLDTISFHSNKNQDQNSDGQSMCSVASDVSSQSIRTASQQSSPRDQPPSFVREQRDSLSRNSVITQKRRTTNSSCVVGCDTNIIVCWLESPDDIAEIPCESLLFIAENGYLPEDGISSSRKLKSIDYAKYFISPMNNGLFRINLKTSFGRQWLALPLVDGMTVSKGILSSLIRESILNLCRRRRLDADSYQPPHVRRRLKIQEVCNTYKISSRYDSTEFYNNLFRNKWGPTTK